jgi:hypothetical protein
MKNTRTKPEEQPSPANADSTKAPAEVSRAPRRTKAILARKDGRQLRRMTVYLPPELARRLAIHAAGADMDVSGALAEIVAGFLDGKTS